MHTDIDSRLPTPPFAVPGPPSLWVRPGSGPSVVVVRWAPPLECSDSGADSQRGPLEIQGYRLQFGLKNASLSTAVDFTSREKNFTVRNLSPGSSYVFVLSAKSRAGYGDVAKQEITVPLVPPLGYPKISDYVNATCCSLHLSWVPPSPEECYDVITEYTVAYREVAVPKPSGEPGPSATPPLSALPRLVTVPASESSYTLLGLNHSTIYMVQLRAHNKAGPGPFSPPVVSRTLAFETGRAGLRTPPPPTPSYASALFRPDLFLSETASKYQASSSRLGCHSRTTEMPETLRSRGTRPPPSSSLLHSLTYTFITSPSPPVGAG